nr:hypothetical protein B11C_150016 [Bartonella sp. 1-1C]
MLQYDKKTDIHSYPTHSSLFRNQRSIHKTGNIFSLFMLLLYLELKN